MLSGGPGLVAGLALWRRAGLRRFAAVQAIVYFVFFAFGAAFSLGTGSATFFSLNTPDHVLHAVLGLLGFIVLMISSARIVEPPPGPLPYPGAVPRADGTYPDEGATPADTSGPPGEAGGPGAVEQGAGGRSDRC